MRTPAVRLGDALESVLRSLGVTKERVMALSFGRPCNCDQRRESLNQWGYRQQERAEAAAKALSAFYFGGTQQRQPDNLENGTSA
jgi:hypothetical protein